MATDQQLFVPVMDVDGRTPLMPTIPSRARRWIQSGRATPFWDHGLFCVRLNAEPSGREKQEIVGAIDPGSKKEGITVKSKAHTLSECAGRFRDLGQKAYQDERDHAHQPARAEDTLPAAASEPGEIGRVVTALDQSPLAGQGATDPMDQAKVPGDDGRG